MPPASYQYSVVALLPKRRTTGCGRSTKPRGRSAAGAIGTVSAFVFAILLLRNFMEYDQQYYLAQFSGVGSLHWFTNGNSGRSENEAGA